LGREEDSIGSQRPKGTVMLEKKKRKKKNQKNN
jgi:hypothetical protein